MKTGIVIVAAAVIALYLYNNRAPQDRQAVTHKAPTFTIAGSSTQTSRSKTEPKVSQTSSRTSDAGISAPRSTTIVVAPLPKIGLKIGANAQTDLTPTINRLKTGPNAQTDLTATIDRLKTGPNAQTDLTMKRSW